MAGMQHLGSTKKGTGTTTRVQPDDDPALLVCAANSKRISVTIYNEGTVKCFLGHTDAVTALIGIPLGVGGILEDNDTDGAWYGITSSGTADLRVDQVV